MFGKRDHHFHVVLLKFHYSSHITLFKLFFALGLYIYCLSRLKTARETNVSQTFHIKLTYRPVFLVVISLSSLASYCFVLLTSVICNLRINMLFLLLEWSPPAPSLRLYLPNQQWPPCCQAQVTWGAACCLLNIKTSSDTEIRLIFLRLLLLPHRWINAMSKRPRLKALHFFQKISHHPNIQMLRCTVSS